MGPNPASLHCLCGAAHFQLAFAFDAPPPGETHFCFGDDVPYRREVYQCGLCGHFVSHVQMDVESLYHGEYVSSSYGENGLLRAFDRINALDPGKSDNMGRVSRFQEFARKHFSEERRRAGALSILDVGSGLCVFLYRMKEAGWSCTALDPDPRAAQHARERVGVKAICTDFMKTDGLGVYDVVTFNKVLEHVEDPIGMLAKAAAHLRPGGIVYIELPDGESAVAEGPGREEFFIEHLHIFSMASLIFLSEKAGFRPLAVERLKEPSTKFTLRAFLTKNIK